ncbi:MAG: hypothetical protein AABX04_06120 [Nanoarchaeota archaeon]
MVFENSIVLGKVSEFIDYALVVAAILAVVYFVRFLLAVREDKAPDRAKRDADWEARGAAGREWIGKKYKNMRDTAEAEEKNRKTEKEKKTIEHLASPLVKKIYHVIIPRCDSIVIKIKKKERESVKKGLAELKEEVESLLKQLKSLEVHVPKEYKSKIRDTEGKTGALMRLIETECISVLPSKTTASDWDTKTDHITNQLDKEVKPRLGIIYNDLDALYS